MGRPIELATYPESVSIRYAAHDVAPSALRAEHEDDSSHDNDNNTTTDAVIDERPLPPGPEATRIRLRVVSKKAQRAVTSSLSVAELEQATRFDEDTDRVYVWFGKALHATVPLASVPSDDESDTESDDSETQRAATSGNPRANHAIQINSQSTGPQTITVRQGTPFDVLY